MQRNSSSFEQGDIVVADLPFAEQVSLKRRPALVISNSQYNKNSDDIILLKITSKGNNTKYDVSFTNAGLTDGELSKPESTIMADNPVTAYVKLIDSKIAKLSEEKLGEVKKKLRELYSL